MAGTENFNGTASQPLTDRGWTILTGNLTPALDTSTGTRYSSGTGTGLTASGYTLAAPPNPESGDSFVEAMVLAISVPFLVVRATSGSRTGYFVQRGSGNVINLSRHDGNATQLLGSYTSTTSELVANKVRLEISGPPSSQSLVVKIAGAVVIGPISDNTYTSGVNAIGCRGAPTSSGAADDMEWGPLSTGGTTHTRSAAGFFRGTGTAASPSGGGVKTRNASGFVKARGTSSSRARVRRRVASAFLRTVGRVSFRGRVRRRNPRGFFRTIGRALGPSGFVRTRSAAAYLLFHGSAARPAAPAIPAPRAPSKMYPSVVPLDELMAINLMLPAASESKAISLDALGDSDAAHALDILRAVTRECLEEGWDFNTERGVVLAPDGNGEIVLPANRLSVDPEEPMCHLVDRAGKLYDPRRHTFAIGQPVKCRLVVSLPFEALPPAARTYITIVAIRRFTDDAVTSSTVHAIKARDEANARAHLERHHNATLDANFIPSWRRRFRRPY